MTHRHPHPPPVHSPQSRRTPRPAWTVLVTWLALVPTLLADRARQARHDESGNVITDNLGMIILGVAAIVVIMAALQAAGTKVITDITKTLGV
jgi:hypothetical protein